MHDRLRIVALLLSLGLWACGEKTAAPEPTEPWQRPTTQPTAARPSTALVYDVESRGHLELRLPAREATPTLGLGPLGGAFQVDFEQLPKTRGTITFHLSELSVLGPDGAPDAAQTQAAQNWLELGAAVSPERKRTLSDARFELDSLDELSQQRLDPRAGRVEGDVRISRIRGTAVGRLVVRQLAVSHRVPIEIEVLSPVTAPAQGEPPAPRIVARLRSAWSVPLAEHDVGPRDE
ncbi:MAG TPA: hypothetical protein VLC09_19840, partial [Polyangiaceae bacterium]|nr:hypothetical protein [Polyangiaceae bacterium]